MPIAVDLAPEAVQLTPVTVEHNPTALDPRPIAIECDTSSVFIRLLEISPVISIL
jgi:hypothetical protein